MNSYMHFMHPPKIVQIGWGHHVHFCVWKKSAITFGEGCIYISNLGHHWFRQWLVAYSTPNHYLNQSWHIVNWTLGNKLQWNFNRNSNVFIEENAFEDVVGEMAAIFSASVCLDACVRHWFQDDVIKWKHFPRSWPFVWGIHRSPMNSPHKGQWRGALMFSLICVWINNWVNNREAGDLRRYRAHCDVIVLWFSTMRCGNITWINTLKPRQNGRHFADDPFECIFFNGNAWISIGISLKFVLKGTNNNTQALVAIMVWRRRRQAIIWTSAV